MIIGQRTAKLLREAIILGHVEGARWAGYTGRDAKENYPRDADVVARVLRAARSFSDIYPSLSKVEGWHRLGGGGR